MSAILLFYIVVVGIGFFLIAAAAGILIRRNSQAKRWRIGIAAMSVAMLFVLLVPIPAREGFISIFTEMLPRLNSAMNPQMPATTPASAIKLREPKPPKANRFAGVIDYVVAGQISADWYPIKVAGQIDAWLDAKNKLIWSGWLALPVGDTMPSLETGKHACRQLHPAGYWALANEAENNLAWQTGGEGVLPIWQGSTLSYIPDDALNIELPARKLRRSGGGSGQMPGSVLQYAVRCVALATGAPENGYRQSDIPLKQWNEYQMKKLVAAPQPQSG